MKIATSELQGAALDRAVAKCEGLGQGPVNGRGAVVVERGFWGPSKLGGLQPYVLRNDYDYWVKRCETYPFDHFTHVWQPTTNWSQGGPIIEREWIGIEAWNEESPWRADKSGEHEQFGPTPLIAAMRCFVASKLGEEVEVPDELA